MNEPHVTSLQSTDGAHVPLQGVTARGTVRGLLFELEVEQRYFNGADTNIEVVYTFPLPSSAVLLGLTVELDGRKLVAAVVEKKAAEQSYEEAIDKGDAAIMLQRAANGLFTMNLGNLMAGEHAVIRYRYAQLLRFEHGAVRLAIPTVIAPRYGDPAAAGLAPHQVPASALSASYPFALTVDLEGAIALGTIASPSHRISTLRNSTGITVALPHDACLDRDLVLNIGGIDGKSLAIVARDGAQIVVLASFCADVPAATAALPLRLKILVDCSGSMAGDSIVAAKRAMHRILAGLAPADRFAFSRFGSQIVHETQGMRTGSGDEVRACAERIEQMDADLGGTEMEGALKSVFAIGECGEAADVLLITDGEVWNEAAMVAAARAARQRVFVVGIGSAPAESVLRTLADSSGGACEFVAPMEDAEAAILRMFARLRAPRIASARIDWPTPPLWMSPLPAGLFGGETVHAFAGFETVPVGDAVLHLVSANEGESLTAPVILPTAVIEDRTLARMGAARRIDVADAAAKLQLALAYGLLTDCTNLLVVHEREVDAKAVDLPALAAVPQMVAAGWHGIGSVAGGAAAMCMSIPDTTRRGRVPGREWSGLEASENMSSLFSIAPDESFSAMDDGKRTAQRSILRSRANTMESLVAFLSEVPLELPTTILELMEAGLPMAFWDPLIEILDKGAAESDIVRAFLEALGIAAKRGVLPAHLPRDVGRVLRRTFADASECAGLRARMLTLVTESCTTPISTP